MKYYTITICELFFIFSDLYFIEKPISIDESFEVLHGLMNLNLKKIFEKRGYTVIIEANALTPSINFDDFMKYFGRNVWRACVNFINFPLMIISLDDILNELRKEDGLIPSKEDLWQILLILNAMKLIIIPKSSRLDASCTSILEISVIEEDESGLPLLLEIKIPIEEVITYQSYL